MNKSLDTSIFIADVCGTLFYDDTTLGLLAHHFSRQPDRLWRLRVLKSMTVRYSPLRLSTMILERLTRKHLLKHLLVRMLANDTVVSLEDSAQEYAVWLLKEKKVDSVWEILDPALKKQQVILASASLEPVIAALSERLGLQYVSSELESLDGVLTGYYRNDLTGKKIQALNTMIGYDFNDNQYDAISDNLTDYNLLNGARKAFVVLHNESHRERWLGLNATYLRLKE